MPLSPPPIRLRQALRKAGLCRAGLRGAGLRAAGLRGADLRGVGLRGVGLRELALAGALMATVAAAIAATAATPAPQLTLAAEDDAAPWSYPDGSGYVNDLVRAAFQAAGWQLTLQVLPYPRCKQAAMRGRAAGCFSTSRTPDAEGALLFPARPVIEARNVLWVLRDSPLQGCAPAAWALRPSVAYVNGYEYTPALDALRERGEVAEQLGDSELESLRKLAARRIDAAVVTVDAVKRIELVQRQAGVVLPLRALCDYGGLPAYVAFSRRHPQGAAARAAFDLGMERLVRSGELARLQQRWAARALELAR